MCRSHNPATQTQGQGHMSRSWDLHLKFMYAPSLLNHLLDFHLTSLKCSPQRVVVLNSWLIYIDSRSRSKYKVMGFTLEFGFHSISLGPFERSSLNFTQMLISVRQRAEPMQTQGQSHSLRSMDLLLNFVSIP